MVGVDGMWTRVCEQEMVTVSLFITGRMMDESEEQEGRRRAKMGYLSDGISKTSYCSYCSIHAGSGSYCAGSGSIRAGNPHIILH